MFLTIIYVVVLFFVVFSFLVIIHEMGHYLMARAFDVDIEIFSIGLGPKVVGFTRNRTLYQLAAIPLGGYVKLAGTDPEATPGSGASERWFIAKPVWKRALIILAGPAMNIIVAGVIFYGAFAVVGEGVPTQVVATVTPPSPAGIAGMRPGDVIIQINKKPMERWSDIKKTIVGSQGAPLTITVLRSSAQHELRVTPILSKFRKSISEVGSEYRIGIQVHLEQRHVDPFRGTIQTVKRVVDISLRMLNALRLLLTGQLPAHTIGGPILMAYQADHHANKGPGALIAFIAIISLSLAIMNLLPIPMLDGGILFFLIVEFFRGRPLTPGAQRTFNVAGLTLILMLMVGGVYFDVVRFFSGDPAGLQMIEELQRIK